MAVTDALTGLSNRRQLEVILTAEIARLAPAEAWLAVIMLDIEFFKLFNDTYDHPEGDRCIAMVAAALTPAVHKVSGMTARYGGGRSLLVYCRKRIQKMHSPQLARYNGRSNH